jgi:tetratricopeptide (TPR) repeat protein
MLLAGARDLVRRRPIVLAPIGLVAVVGVALLPAALRRFSVGGEDLRLDLWRSALTIFAEHPVTGGGPGTWVQLKIAANSPGAPNLILPQAHNMYVQAAAEVGIVGLIALAALAVAVLHRLWTGWRSTTDGSTRAGSAAARPTALSLEAGAAMVSLAAFAGQSIVDNLTNLPFVCLLLIALVAWIDGRLAQSEPVRPEPGQSVASRGLAVLERGPLLYILGLLACALVIPTLLRIDRAAALAVDGNDAALRGHWQVALDKYDAARMIDPGFTLYEIQTASALARVGRTSEARDMLARAVESDPVAVNVIGLAALEAELGDREAALAHVRQAIALSVNEPVVALNAGLIAERLGEPELALDQFANAIALDAPLASSRIWASPPRLHTRAEIVAAARARVESLAGALILAYAGHPDTARRELNGMPGSDRRDVYIAAVEWQARDVPAALARLDAILAARPLDWFAAAWAARISKLSLNDGAFNRYSKWAITVQGDSAPGVIADRALVPAGFDAPTANLPGNYPWAVYLRPISPYLLAPQLTLIGLR